jgi:N-acetylneuraminic acid mutarotase
MIINSKVHTQKGLSFFMLIVCVLPCWSQQNFPDLPEAVTNNAVVKVETLKGVYFLSFMGLGQGKTFNDVHNKTWALKEGEKQWQLVKPVPSSSKLKGRLASVAVGIKDKAYLFGGYTVAENDSEVSSPDNYAYDVVHDRYQLIAASPVPVDDAVALVYQQRYVYLISGWHNDGNVNLVQVYDSDTDSWQQASPFPGAAVFGHAGGIVDNQLLVCDGVKVEVKESGKRSFSSQAACYSGLIDRKNINKIEWHSVPHPTGIARYRMAATGLSVPQPGIVFVGGSLNPYNYNGIGYDGVPSTADNKLWFYNFDEKQWFIKNMSTASMDHRGLLISNNDNMIIIGGMRHQQEVSNQIQLIPSFFLKFR